MQTMAATATAISVFPNNLSMMPSSSSSSLSVRGNNKNTRRRRSHVSSAATDEVSSRPSSSAKVGRRVRVKAPVRVFHVSKAPELDLMGMEGFVKNYVGIWNGKRISANLPFKVDFLIDVKKDGQDSPLRFFAHLKEDEFDYLT